MNRSTVFVLLMLLSFVLNGQQGNPFDIEDRLEKKEIKKEQKSNNVFDIQREESAKDSATVEAKKTEVVSTQKEPVEKTYISNGSNPFEVDHVPSRKRPSLAVDKETAKKIKGSKKSSNIFIFWLVLLSLIIIAIVLNTQRNTLPKLFKALTNENILKLNNREEKGGNSGIYLLLYIVYFINAAAFLYLVLVPREVLESGMLNFFYLLVGLLVIYLLRHFAMFVLGTFFPVGKEPKLYNFTIISFNLVIGVFLIPINLLLAFGPQSILGPILYIGLGIIGVLLVLRLLRGLFIAIPYIISNTFHFLLYLCTFEISPLLLIFKSLGL